MSEIRVNKITNRSGLGTVTVSNAGAVFGGEKTGFGTDNPRYQLEVGAVGAGGTQLWVNGDARVTGIMSIGQGTITLDPDSNMIKLGALTMHRDSVTGDALLMSTNGDYNPFRASKFLIDATEVIDNNRNFTGVDANFSGNVSVGGTLTYEDVTNIDSIGVVTARSGVHFGTSAAGTLVVGNATGIGIGTDNPATKLVVASSDSTAADMRFQNSGTGYAANNGMWVGINDNEDGAIYNYHNSSLLFGTNDAERLRITSGGSVNIGGDYTQTGYKAQITGDLLIQKNQAAYQHPQIELYNYNTGGYGGAIKFTGNHAGTKYTQGTIRTYGGSNTSDGSLAFFTGDGTEKLRITSAGNVSIQDGNLVVASGHGIDFSATSGPAGMQSEILDDYEEGTFTPILSQGYTGISHGTGYPVGDYVKVGQLCHVSISFYFSSTGYQSTSRVRIEGLPFAGNSLSGNFAGFLTYGFGSISLNNYNSLGWYIPNNQTYTEQYAMNGPTGYNTYPNANASNHWIQISGTYRVD